MIRKGGQGDAVDPDSFGERVRLMRQRLRTRAGRRWTQGDLAAAIGVERNTVSRWENGGILPKDPGTLAALAHVLRVSSDWLLSGIPSTGAAAAEGMDVAAGRDALHEQHGGGGSYRTDSGELALLPPAAAELVRGYLSRMARAGCSLPQLRAAESFLLAGASNSIGRDSLAERSDAEIASDVDAAWDFVTHVLRRDNIRP